MSTRELIEQEIDALPEPLQRNVDDYAVRLKNSEQEGGFNGAKLSESVLARDWDSPREDAAWKKL